MKKFELNVVNFDNEDVIATSADYNFTLAQHDNAGPGREVINHYHLVAFGESEETWGPFVGDVEGLEINVESCIKTPSKAAFNEADGFAPEEGWADKGVITLHVDDEGNWSYVGLAN